MSGFSQTTFAQAKAQLALRLGDPDFVFWSDFELGLCIKEALQTWQAAANYWTSTGVFTTTAGTAFYDLNSKLSSQLGNTTTDADVITMMEYQLLEPPTPTAWTGSEMFTLDDLTQALQRRRNQFLLDTGIYIALPTEINVTPAGSGIVDLDQTVAQIRRVAWKAPDSNGLLDATHGVFTQLPRTDTFVANAQIPGWSVTPDTPEYYLPYYASAVTTLQLAPIPIDIGRVELLSVNTGAALDPTIGVLMGLNDDFIPYVRYGALADLLGQEGMATDAQRAAYGEQRYREGVELGKLTFTMVQTKINGVPVPQMSLDDFDYQIAGWQNDSDQPEDIAAGNSNLIALHPVPDDVYSVEMVIATNAILPASDIEYLQISPAYLDAILGMAQHVACFKLGGVEFQMTLPLYEQFMKQAAGYNSLLAANASSFDVLSDSGNREQEMRPQSKAA